MVGDFDERTTLNLISNHFGPVAASPHPVPPMYTVEPPQEGEHRFILRRAGQLGLVEIAWHIPETKHPDTAAFVVLDQILSAGVSSRLTGSG